MPERMTIAVAQPSTVAHDVEGNAQRHAELIDDFEAQLFVFPEMSLTGYEFDADPVDVDDIRLDSLVEACRRTGTVALVGAPVAAPSGKSIGMLLIDGKDTSVAYRKIWLGDREADAFVPGRRPAVAVVDGRRVGLAICKDTGVPRHAADTVALGIDIYAAGVLEHAIDADVQPSRARHIARALGVWVAVASFAGPTGEGYDITAGGSAVWAPDGSLVTSVGDAPGLVAIAAID